MMQTKQNELFENYCLGTLTTKALALNLSDTELNLERRYTIGVGERHNMRLYNRSNCRAKITIYYATCRRDLGIGYGSMATLFSAGLEANHDEMADETDVTVAPKQVTPADAANIYVTTQRGVTPYMSEWTRLVKIRRYKSHVLRAGEAWNVMVKTPFVMKRAEAWSAEETRHQQGGQCLFFQVDPYPAQDTTTAGLVNEGIMNIVCQIQNNWWVKLNSQRPNDVNYIAPVSSYATAPGTVVASTVYTDKAEETMAVGD